MKNSADSDIKTNLTGGSAAEGTEIIHESRNYAFVIRGSREIVFAVPTKKKFKPAAVDFDALDFLKFREGVVLPGEPWKYLMIQNGIHRITMAEEARELRFEKMPEGDWADILPGLAEMMESQKTKLLQK